MKYKRIRCVQEMAILFIVFSDVKIHGTHLWIQFAHSQDPRSKQCCPDQNICLLI